MMTPRGSKHVADLSHYFIKLCFDCCQFAFYLYLQHNGMHKVKICCKDFFVTFLNCSFILMSNQLNILVRAPLEQ